MSPNDIGEGEGRDGYCGEDGGEGRHRDGLAENNEVGDRGANAGVAHYVFHHHGARHYVGDGRRAGLRDLPEGSR